MSTIGPGFARSLQPPALAAPQLPARVREALQDVLSLLFDEVVRKVDLALNELELQLQQRADMARNAAEHARATAALRRVQRNRDALPPRFLELLEAEFARLREAPTPVAPKPAAAAPVRFEDLRLVDDNEADEDTVLRTITLRHESRAGLPLQLLGQRFGVLAGRAAFDAQTLPVGPHHLAELLSEACEVMEVGKEVRLLLLQLFDKQVLSGYEVLADLMNTALARRNVLPTLSFVPLRRNPRAMDDATTRAPLQTVQTVAPRAQADSAAEFDFLQQLLERRRGLLGRLRAGGAGPEVAAMPLDTRELLSSLAPLQGQAQLLPLAQVRAHVQSAHPSHTLSRGDSDTLELLALLHARLLREMREGGLGAQLLERPQVVLLRVVLADRRFFTHPRHPARELLESVAEAGARGVAEDDVDPQFRSALIAAVDSVVRDFDGDVAVFDAANRNVAEAAQAAAHRAEVAERRQVDSARGRERMAAARHRANAAIESGLEGLTLPRLVRSLLTQAWGDVLTLTALRNDEDSDDWHAHLDLTHDIIAAVQSPGEGEHDMAARVCEALTTVGYHEAEAAMIARRLAGLPETDDDAASRTELAMRLKARARLGEDRADGSTDVQPLQAAEQFHYDDLVTTGAGRWFEFDEDDGTQVRRRLAFVGEASGLAVFVNRRGQRVAELRLDELARKMAAARVRPVRDDSTGLVERAWQATLSALRGFGGAAADEDGE